MKQGKGEFLDRFQESFNIMVEVVEGYGCVFGSEQVLWETDERWKILLDHEKEQEAEIQGVTERSRERLLAYGFTSALSDRFDAFKKELKADYSQGNNNYKETVVESYQMALDVMRIYQKRPGHQDKKKEQTESGADKEGTAFVQKGDTKKENKKDNKKESKEKKCFKCEAADYKTCPCDNMKRVREHEAQKK